MIILYRLLNVLPFDTVDCCKERSVAVTKGSVTTDTDTGKQTTSTADMSGRSISHIRQALKELTALDLISRSE